MAGALLAAALPGGREPYVGALAAERGPGVRAQRADPDRLAARELRRLPGIGPTRALAIVRARWDGLRGGPSAWIAIPGIGPATVEAAGAAHAAAVANPEAGFVSTPDGTTTGW